MGSWLLGGVAVLVVGGLAVALVGLGIRLTVARQEAGLPPPPACPPGGTALLSGQARYLGTTFAPSAYVYVILQVSDTSQSFLSFGKVPIPSIETGPLLSMPRPHCVISRWCATQSVIIPPEYSYHQRKLPWVRCGM